MRGLGLRSENAKCKQFTLHVQLSKS